MESKRSYILPIVFLLMDLLLLTGIYILSSYIWPKAWAQERFVFHVLLWLMPLSWSVISFILNIYNHRQIQFGRTWNIRKISSGFLLLVGVVLLVVVFGKFHLSRLTLFLYLLLNLVGLLASGYVRNQILNYIRLLGYSPRRIVFVGDDDEIHQLKQWIAIHPERGFQETQILKYDETEPIDTLLARIRNIADTQPLEELTLGAFHESSKDVVKLIDLAEEFGLRVFLQSTISKAIVGKSTNTVLGPFSVIRVRQEPLNRIRARVLKRSVDLAITLPVFFFVYWWFYMLMVLLIKISSKGPVIYTQERIGIGGKPFLCYKFRTMHHNEPREDRPSMGTSNKDKRITWIGRILRATNLDELPQFINVLKGEMSVAGPRPHMVEEDEAISSLLRKYKIRRFVKPGITGWAAVNGFRGATDDMTLMQTRIDYDIYYIENWTPWLDTRIFFSTVWKMLTFNTGGK